MRLQRGYTLIELMISVGLFGAISTGAMSLVMSANRAQNYSAKVDVAQSSVRWALDFLTRDVMSVSAGASTGVIGDGATGALKVPIVVTESAGLPDTLDLYLVDPLSQAYALTAVTNGTTSFALSAGAPTFKVNDILQLSDLSAAMLLKVTGVAGTSVSFASANLPAGAPASYPQGSWVFKSRHVTYKVVSKYNTTFLAIDLNDGNGAQLLAEGIEDFQVALGFDANGDGTLSEVGASAGDDDWVFNVAGETAPASLVTLAAARVTLVAKSTSAIPGPLLPGKPKTEDNPAGTSDRFLRRVVRSVITLRNFSL